MKNNTRISITKTLSGFRFVGGGFWGMALIALALSARAAIYDVDVSRYTLYTDPIHPEREIKLGGFSGLFPVPGDSTGTLFYTVTDRGPTQDFEVVTTNPDGTTKTVTYKALPCHDMAPMIVMLQLHANLRARVVQIIPLRREAPDGFAPITGWANGVELAPEVLNDVFYTPLGFDPDGLDPEGITIDKWGYFWICEEYRPSIAMIDCRGTVLARLVPHGRLTGTETIPTFDVLPTVLEKRVNNRGMEGIAYTKNGRLYAVVQRPLANPTKAVSEASSNLRIVEVNLNSLFESGCEPQVRQLIYRTSTATKGTYASDLFALNPAILLVPERATDKLYAINLSPATDITPFEDDQGKLITPFVTEGGKVLDTIEQLNAEQLAALGIQTVKKAEILPSLKALHPELAKCEGVSVVGKTIVLTYDNDFNLGDLGDGSTTPGSIVLKPKDVYPAVITTPMPEEIVFDE